MRQLSFLDLIHNDLERVESLLQEQPQAQHAAIGMAMDHLINGGGKRIRPALVILSSHLCDADLERAVFAAAAVEMLHTATLIHDDLIDGSLMRRGVETLSSQWSPAATVLAGDYVFAQAADLAARSGSVSLMKRFAETLMIICNGEIRQMFDGKRDKISREQYERHIYAKTAALIAMSAEAGAILAGAPKDAEALRTYGRQLGLAFQIIDDILDFVADEELLGKPVGSDLRHGLITLPLLFFLEAEPEHPVVSQALVSNPSDLAIREAAEAVADSGAIDRALEVAQQYAGQAKVALNTFSDSPYLAALLELADFTVRRSF